MSDSDTEALAAPEARGIEVATVELVFDEPDVRPGIGTPLEIVEEDSDAFTRGLAARLSLALGVQVFVTDVQVVNGSISLKARIVALVIPIIQGAAGGAIGNWATQPSPPSSPPAYTQVCETVRTTTETYSTEYFKKKGYTPKTTRVVTTTFQHACRQVLNPRP